MKNYHYPTRLDTTLYVVLPRLRSTRIAPSRRIGSYIYIYMCVYTRDGDLRVGDSIYTDFGRHQFGITARETRDTTSKTARHATARFSTRETRPRFRGHPAPMYHRDTIELELPEIIPSYYRGVVISRRTTLRVYPDPLYFTY